jgi:glycosyltransferase involved in cell wall biosynthesis
MPLAGQIMKILFLTNAYPDFKSSYHGIFIKKMAVLLKDEGYKIYIVTPKIYKGSLYFEDQDGIKVYRFPFFSGNKLLIEYERIPYLKMILYYLTGSFLTLYVFLKHRCHLIHAHWAIPTGLIGVFVGSLLRRPLFVTVHGSDYRIAMERHSILHRIFFFVCKKAKHITCVSELQKREIEKLGIKGKISIFPMGVDEVLLEAGRKREANLTGRNFTILSNRNLLPIYNVSLLIRAIPMVINEEPEVRFLIAGEGSERENLEREARSLNIEKAVQFIGRIPHKDMADLLGRIDIYISTSLYDGTSVSLLEAMAAGAFPIVTNIPANREWIVEGENGFLFPENNEKILAKNIIEAIQNRTLLEKSRDKNLSIVEKKALWSVCIRKIKDIYQAQLP